MRTTVCLPLCVLLLAACGQDLDRREFGDQYIPPVDSLGNVDFEDDDGGGDDDGPTNVDDDGDDGGPGGGPLDDGHDGGPMGDGGDDLPDPDDGNDDDLPGPSDDGPGDDGTGDGPAADDGDDGPMESPYIGGWDVGNCQNDIVSTGSGVGDIIPDFSLLDQNGDMVRLYDFCHKAVWLIEGAFW